MAAGLLRIPDRAHPSQAHRRRDLKLTEEEVARIAVAVARRLWADVGVIYVIGIALFLLMWVFVR